MQSSAKKPSFSNKQQYNLTIQSKLSPSILKNIDLISSPNLSMRKSISIKSQVIKFNGQQENTTMIQRNIIENNIKKVKKSTILRSTFSSNFYNKNIQGNAKKSTEQSNLKQRCVSGDTKNIKINKYRYKHDEKQSFNQNINVNDLLENCRKRKISPDSRQNITNKNIPLQSQSKDLVIFQNDHLRKTFTISKTESQVQNQAKSWLKSSSNTSRSPKTPNRQTKIGLKATKINFIKQFQNQKLKFNPLSCKKIKGISNEDFYNFHLASLVFEKQNHSNLNQNEQEKFFELIQKIRTTKNKDKKSFIPMKIQQQNQKVNIQQDNNNMIISKNNSQVINSKDLITKKINNQSSLLQSAVLWSNQRINLMRRKMYSPEKSKTKMINQINNKKKQEYKLQGWQNKNQCEEAIITRKQNLIISKNKNFLCSLLKSSNIIYKNMTKSLKFVDKLSSSIKQQAFCLFLSFISFFH